MNETTTIPVETPTAPISDWTPPEVYREGSRLACAYLFRRGLDVLETGWRCDAGNVDIVARDGEAVVLVDLKARRDSGIPVMPSVTVDRERQRHYRKLALCYLLAHPEVDLVRVDVVSVVITAPRCARLRHLIDAFTWDER